MIHYYYIYSLKVICVFLHSQNTLSTTLFQKAIPKHKDYKGSVWYRYEWCSSRRICQISPDREVVFLYRRLHDRTLMPSLLSPTGCPTFLSIVAAATYPTLLSKLCNQLIHYIVRWPKKTAPQEDKKANYAGDPPSVPMLSAWSVALVMICKESGLNICVLWKSFLLIKFAFMN
jgi:hypothetical protein